MSDILNVGNRVKILMGKPYFDYHAPNITKDLKPELVGKRGTILDRHPMKGYWVLIDTRLPITGKGLFWFNELCIRRLTFFEKVVDWLHN